MHQTFLKAMQIEAIALIGTAYPAISVYGSDRLDKIISECREIQSEYESFRSQLITEIQSTKDEFEKFALTLPKEFFVSGSERERRERMLDAKAKKRDRRIRQLESCMGINHIPEEIED